MPRCALCHDDLAPGSEHRCEGCGTLLHPECAAGIADCPTLGCARRWVRDAAKQVAPAPRRWRPGWGALTALGLLLCLLSPCGMGQLAIVRARLVDAERLRREVDRLLVERPLDLTDARGEDPFTAEELASYPYLAELQDVRRWGDDGIMVRTGSGIPALVAVVVVRRGADTRSFERRPDGYTRFSRLADRVYLYEGYR